MTETVICAKCGKTDKEHEYWTHIDNKEHHCIIKDTEQLSKKRSLQRKRMNLESPGREVLLVCMKYHGCCVENNYCYGLERPRPGDFGWGECIHQVMVECAYWSQRRGMWVLSPSKLKKWLKGKGLKNFMPRRRD